MVDITEAVFADYPTQRALPPQWRGELLADEPVYGSFRLGAAALGGPPNVCADLTLTLRASAGVRQVIRCNLTLIGGINKGMPSRHVCCDNGSGSCSGSGSSRKQRTGTADPRRVYEQSSSLP